MDHLVYKEVFIDKIYDDYILHTLENSLRKSKTIKVLDLGANLGFFSIRCCEILLQLGSKSKVEFEIYEPSKNCIERLADNLKVFKSKGFSFNIHNNLVGKKSGWDWFIEDKDHHIGQCVSKKIESKGHRYSRKVDYSDLTQQLKCSAIDLLKCDIEGSEIEFLKNYSHSLNNVNSIIIETHGDKAKDFTCKLMKRMGFFRYTKKEINKNAKYCNFYFYKDILQN